MLCEQLNENLQGGVWGFLNTKALQLALWLTRFIEESDNILIFWKHCL